MIDLSKLTEDGKEEIALMILLWKDFKCSDKFDMDICIQAIQFAEMFGIRKEYESLISKLPPMSIRPKY